MPRGLDHIIHAVRDLDGAAALYRRLGFNVGVRNRHPWGTHNCIVQFPGVFVELLTMADPQQLGNDGLSDHFGRGTQEFLERQEGLSFVILESADVAADAAEFAAAGISASGVLSFEREGRTPDGARVKVGFALAFARDDHAPDVGFAVCRHLHPEDFWHPQLQRHVNSVATVAGVVLVAENPSDHHIFVSAFTGERQLHATSNGVTALTPRGEISVMDPTAFLNRFGVSPPDVSGGARLAAVRFAVRDPAAMEKALRMSGVPSAPHMGAVVVAPEAVMGATLVFEAG